MPGFIDQLLAEFVNRESELALLHSTLESEKRSLVCFWGPSGVGKTYLMLRLAHEATTLGWQCVELRWSPGDDQSYHVVLREIVKGLKEEWFQPFTDLVNYYTIPGYRITVNQEGKAPLSVLEGARLDTVRTGDIAAVIIKDLHLAEPRDDKEIPREERMQRLTDAFVECLVNATRSEKIVIFLDGEDALPQETAHWLWGRLLARLRDGRMGQVKVVLAGRKAPALDRTWFVAETREVRPLDENQVVVYLERRGVVLPASELRRLARSLLNTSGGDMEKVADFVDIWLRPEAA